MEEPQSRRAFKRRRQRRETLRVMLEVGALTTLAVLVLTVLGFVLTAGKGRSAPPPGTLVVSQPSDFQTIDPALATEREAWELEYATCAKLMNYPPKARSVGTRLEPEVAAAQPHVSDDGRTYTFRIADGWKFSNGEAVTPRAFVRAFERARTPNLVSPAEPYLREVSSWRADGDELTIHLKERAPDFLQRLALPYFCAVPPETPATPVDTIPSAGPFFVKRHAHNRSLVL